MSGHVGLSAGNAEKSKQLDEALFISKWPGQKFWESPIEGEPTMAKRLALKRKAEPIRQHDPDEDFKVGQMLKAKTGMVSVALKLPNGIFLQLYEFIERQEPILGGGYRTFKMSRAVEGSKYRLNGNTFPFGQPPNFLIIGNYGITPNIPENVWDKWLEQNKDSDLVRNKLIFAYRSGDKVADCAKEHAKTRSGMEPIAINRDGSLDMSDSRLRVFAKQGNLSGIEKANEKE